MNKVNTFEEIVQQQKKVVNAIKESNLNGMWDILADLYNDPSHFIYEILQNAEDTSAEYVRFELYKDKIDIYHNGRNFNIADIVSITGIGISTKKENINAIGKFGVGFKSVFAITESPSIYSGEYSFEIKDFAVPYKISPIPQQGIDEGYTKICLPFNHREKTPESILDMLQDKLEKLDLKTLLFLKNIREIQYKTPRNKGHYIKEERSFKNKKNVKKITVISETSTSEYIKFEKNIQIDNNELVIAIAYKLDGEQIIPENDSRLFVFFPTEKETYLKFLIHGPFKTTPTRENIPISDVQNKAILEEISNLVAESISVVKSIGLLNTSFFNILPIQIVIKETKGNDIYLSIFEEVKNKFLSDEDLLPTHNKDFTRPEKAALARGKELTGLLNPKDLEKLFLKTNWLDTSITENLTKELWDYLKKELDITEVDFEFFAKNIDSSFFEDKTDEWMMNFYRKLIDQKALWRPRLSWQDEGILRKKPIIRIENNTHVIPFVNKKPQVYLPSNNVSYFKTVKEIFVKDEQILNFFGEFGLSEPDKIAEIREIILPKYENSKTVENFDEYLSDFKIILQYGESPLLKEDLRQSAFLISDDLITLRKPEEVYFNSKELKEYFTDSESASFISEKLINSFEQEKIIKFLKNLGIQFAPKRIISSKTYLNDEKRKKLREQSDLPNASKYNFEDYDIENLNDFLDNPTKKGSISLWNMFISDVEEEYFQGLYWWTHYASYRREAKFDAFFIKRLQYERWLINKDGQWNKPSEMLFSELDEKYRRDGKNVSFLTHILQFKPDVYDKLPEKDKEFLELSKKHHVSIDEFKEFVMQREKNKEEDTEIWDPSLDPDEVDSIKVIEIEPNILITEDLSGQTDKLDTKDGDNKDNKNDKSKKPHKETTNKVGCWGEKFVFEHLKKEYGKIASINHTDYGFASRNINGDKIDIVWLNKDGNIGKGFDFVLKINNEEKNFIEVKTTKFSDSELIKVTGTQWKFARQLFNQGKGDCYYIYVVFNAGEENAFIRIFKNPFKLWKEGRIYAHPVNLEFSSDNDD